MPREAIFFVTCLMALAAGCSESQPPLAATDVFARAPLSGTSAATAYLTLHNHSTNTITIRRVSSPEFAKIEMHESKTQDGIVRMRRLDSLIIDHGTSVRFESGGRHLMLIGPIPGLASGDTVTLKFEYNDGGMLAVSTQLSARL